MHSYILHPYTQFIHTTQTIRPISNLCTILYSRQGHTGAPSHILSNWPIICSPKKKKTKQNVTQITNKLKYRKPYFYLQSKCFFFGPIISSVVALQTDLANPWPAKLCRAANSLSFIVCPAIFFFRSKNYDFFFFLFFTKYTPSTHAQVSLNYIFFLRRNNRFSFQRKFSSFFFVLRGFRTPLSRNSTTKRWNVGQLYCGRTTTLHFLHSIRNKKSITQKLKIFCLSFAFICCVWWLPSF